MKDKTYGRVVHCKREKFDVYIGRPGPWGNPFTLTSESERDEVIKKYRAWLLAEIKAGRIERNEVLSLRGKTLGCWCDLFFSYLSSALCKIP